MNKNDKIYIAGHRGLVGSAIVRNLKKNAYNNLILRTSKELDLTNQADVYQFFETEKPDGTPRKLLDVSKLDQTGWKAKTGLMDGIQTTYDWFVANIESFRS